MPDGVELRRLGIWEFPSPAGLFDMVPAPVLSVEMLPVAAGPEFTASGEPGFTTVGSVAEGDLIGGTVDIWAKAGPASSNAVAAILNLIIVSRLKCRTD